MSQPIYRLFQGDKVVYEGPNPTVIIDLDPDTVYPEGTFRGVKVLTQNARMTSPCSIPEFKTKTADEATIMIMPNWERLESVSTLQLYQYDYPASQVEWIVPEAYTSKITVDSEGKVTPKAGQSGWVKVLCRTLDGDAFGYADLCIVTVYLDRVEIMWDNKSYGDQVVAPDGDWLTIGTNNTFKWYSDVYEGYSLQDSVPYNNNRCTWTNTMDDRLSIVPDAETNRVTVTTKDLGYTQVVATAVDEYTRGSITFRVVDRKMASLRYTGSTQASVGIGQQYLIPPPTISPWDTSNKKLKYTSMAPNSMTVDPDTGMCTVLNDDEGAVYVHIESTDGSNLVADYVIYTYNTKMEAPKNLYFKSSDEMHWELNWSPVKDAKAYMILGYWVKPNGDAVEINEFSETTTLRWGDWENYHPVLSGTYYLEVIAFYEQPQGDTPSDKKAFLQSSHEYGDASKQIIGTVK